MNKYLHNTRNIMCDKILRFQLVCYTKFIMKHKKQFILGFFALCSVVGGFLYINRCDAVCAADVMREEMQNFSHIPLEDFKEQLPGAVVLDVRTPEEYVTGHIPESMLINLYAEDFKSRVGQLDRDVPYYVYCRSGNRSRDAVAIMKTAGFKRVFGLEGGIGAWREGGYELE